MARTRPFGKLIAVSNSLPDEISAAWVTTLTDPTPWDVTGPRGGRYIADGPLSELSKSDQYGDAWMRNETVYQVERMGRYVRPGRK